MRSAEELFVPTSTFLPVPANPLEEGTNASPTEKLVNASRSACTVKSLIVNNNTRGLIRTECRRNPFRSKVGHQIQTHAER
mmetsp:Transcript_30323/g.39724  ORF Transcript_30323/g.39724 Transcript_30323/m.39724 type:complete len:81 (+) Transcript_30323:70-312(+)